MLTNRFDCHHRIDELSLWKLYLPASRLARTWWIRKDIQNPETVAQHQMDAAILVGNFRRKLEKMEANIIIIQDTLLLHDIAEPDPRVGDITPHCNVSPTEKRRREEETINEMLWNNPYALKLWYDYEDGRTIEWRLSMEFDKLHAVLKARYYEDSQDKVGLTEEFYKYAVLTKQQIRTPFLVNAALAAYESKPR